MTTPRIRLLELLAATFGIPRQAVTIVSGATWRKVVELTGITEESVRRLMKR